MKGPWVGRDLAGKGESLAWFFIIIKPHRRALRNLLADSMHWGLSSMKPRSQPPPKSLLELSL